MGGSWLFRFMAILLVLETWLPQCSFGGTLIWAPMHLKLPFSALVGLAALSVAKLSLATAVLSKGNLKVLKTAKKRNGGNHIVSPLSFLPSPNHLDSGPFPSFEHNSISFVPPGPFGPGGFGPHPFGDPYIPHSFGGPGPFFPLRGPPSPRVIPEFLKTKMVDPKDACILKMICEFEFNADKLGGGAMEKMLLGLVGTKPRLHNIERRDLEENDDDFDDNEKTFWINIKRTKKSKKHGAEICENRYPSCYFSPVFKLSKRSADERTTPSKSGGNVHERKFVDIVRKRIWELYGHIQKLTRTDTKFGWKKPHDKDFSHKE